MSEKKTIVLLFEDDPVRRQELFHKLAGASLEVVAPTPAIRRTRPWPAPIPSGSIWSCSITISRNLTKGASTIIRTAA